MSTKTKPVPETPTQPPISLVDPPTAEAQLVTMTKERDALLVKVETLKADGEALEAKLAKLEKNPLLMVLNTFDAGAVIEEAGETLNGLTEDCRRLNGKGAFTLKLAIAPLKGSVDALVFTPTITATAPKPETAPAIFYSSKDGLSRNDPRQREFKFRGTVSRADRSSPEDSDPYGDEGGEH